MGGRAPFSSLLPRLSGPPPPRPLPRRPQVHMVRMYAAAEQGTRARPPRAPARRCRAPAGIVFGLRAAAVLATFSPAELGAILLRFVWL